MNLCRQRPLRQSTVRLLLLSGWLACLLILAPHSAQAVFVGASSATQTTDLGGGNTEYRYTITNTSNSGGPNMLEWAIPFFDDAATSFVGGESSIFAPPGWDHLFTALTPAAPGDTSWDYVAADDPKNDTYGAPGTAFDNPPYALVFYTFSDFVPAGDSRGDFGFVSSYSGANVPFIAGFDNLQLTIGDPIGPITPSFPVSNFSIGQFPEPTSLTLLALGALAAISWRRRRK